MRKRIAAVGLGVILGANFANAQQPQPIPFPLAPLPPVANTPGSLPFPASPTTPGLLPQTLLPKPPAFAPAGPPVANSPGSLMAGTPELPQTEQKVALSTRDVSVKRVVGGWEVWAGPKVLRNTGDSEANARDVARVLRDLRPTEWVVIGSGKPVIEYGLTNGRPAVAGVQPEPKDGGNVGQAGGFAPQATGAGPKFVQPIDLRTTRVEAIRGVWCVRDDNNILLNFGTDRGGADQASAVIQKYGFNRVGVVGTPAQPVMSYLFVSLDQVPQQPGGAALMTAQIDSLTRTGIPIPGVGFTGEMVKIEPRKVEVRKDGAEWVVACGPEVLGRFGPTEWAAREAARAVQDAKFTEFCKLGGASGLTFFLTDGKPPKRAPYNAQGRTFDPAALKVQEVNQKWVVTDAGKHLFDVGSAQEGETVVRVLKAYGFDQTAHLTAGGGGMKAGITFLVKNGR